MKQGYGQAFMWYAKAVKQGDIDGQYNVANCYRNCCGEQNDVLVMKWYENTVVGKWVKQAENFGSFHEKDNRTPEQEK